MLHLRIYDAHFKVFDDKINILILISRGLYHPSVFTLCSVAFSYLKIFPSKTFDVPHRYMTNPFLI